MLRLLKAITFLPVKVQLWIGCVLGFLLFLFAKKRRRVIKANLRACFPNLSKKKINQICFKNWINTGIGTIEIAMTFWLSDARLKKISTIKGLENIKKANAESKAIIFLPAHFTPMFLAGRILHLYQPLTLIFYQQNNPTFAKEMDIAFRRHGFKSINNRSIRSMLKAINNKESLWLPCDQDYGSQLFSPFFEEVASTISTPARIGKDREVCYLPVRYYRKKTRYHLIIEKEIKNFPKTDMQKNANQYNQIIEKHILKNIDQYLWIHQRFKTRPEGREPIY